MDIRKKTMSKPMMKSFTKDQMEELAQNRDNIVMTEVESKDPTAHHKFTSVFEQQQILAMRKLFEEYLVDYPSYSENDIRTKVLNSKAGNENSWKIIIANKPRIAGVVLKKFTNEQDRKFYDVLQKTLECEVLREQGILRTDEQINAYWKRVGLHQEMNPIQNALDKLKK